MSQAHTHEMIRSVTNLIAVGLWFIEVDQPNGFWTYLGIGILIINFIHFLRHSENEQKDI